MENNLKILISKEELYEKIKITAQKINESYSSNEELYAICVLKGAVMFYCELLKHLTMPIKMEFVRLSSYGASTKSSGKIIYDNINLPNLDNKNVLIVEDIIDTGLTLNFFKDYLNKNYKNCNIKTAVLFDKKCKRQVSFTPDFSAFDIDDKFIVGFGLDYDEKYRNLNHIGYFEG